MAKKNILKEGIELYNHGDYTNALTFFLSLPEDCGADSLELTYYLGLCYAKLKRYDDAILYLEQVVTSFGETQFEQKMQERVLQCRYILAVIYCISGRKKLADFELTKLLDAGYKTASVYASLAFIAWEQEKVELSLSYYEKALENDDSNPTALNGIAYVIACENGDLTRALTYSKKAYSILPENAAVLDTLGWIYFKMGLFKEAREFLDKALKKDEKNPIIQEHLEELQKAEEQ